ncbi:MAG: PIG-L family deacetylase [Chloroflexi bacterium]|nr:PIG-L family deacetylase [Chloroflexota bacterium]
MTNPVTILAVRPHPDDECTATGGVLARYAAMGVRTGVVCCTGGEEGEIHDPDLDLETAKPQLHEIRERELRAACRVLGVGVVRLLGYRDSGMAGTPANQNPAAFCNVDVVEASGRLVRVVRELRPRIIITEAEGGGYPHPDHIMCHTVTIAAVAVAGDPRAFPEAGPPWDVPKVYTIANVDDGTWDRLEEDLHAAGIDEPWLRRRRETRRSRPAPKRPEDATVAVDVADFVEVRRAALACHRTQIPQDSFWMKLPPDLARRAFAKSYFIRVKPLAAPGEYEIDLLDPAPSLDGVAGRHR